MRAYPGGVVPFLVAVVVVAVVTYVGVRALLERGPRRPPRGRRTPEPAARPWAPDDDDEFLAELDRRRRSD